MHPLSLFQYCPICGAKAFHDHNFKSKRCEQCGFVYYFNPCAATLALLLNEENELLVCQRAKEPAKGTFDLPGGFCDMDETIEEGMLREIKEETGLVPTHIEYLFSLPNRYPFSGFEVHSLDCFFLCRVSDISSLRSMDDAANCHFLPLDQIDPSLFGLTSVRTGLQRFLKDPQA